MNKRKKINYKRGFMFKRIINVMMFVIIMMSCFVGCDEATKPDPKVDSVDVTPSNVTVHRGQTHQFSAVVNGSNNPSQGVTWTVQNGVSGTHINSEGLLTVASDETATTLTIFARSSFDNTKSGNSTVHVPSPTVETVVITPNSVDVRRGQTQQFTAVVNGANNPPQSVTWSVTGGGDGTNINESGLLTVASNESAVRLTVIARSNVDTSKQGNAIVNVTGAIITSVAINPSNINVATGSTQDFTASVIGQHNPPQTVTWSISGNNSTNTNINSSGRLTVAGNEGASTLTVTATSTYDNTKSNTAIVTISIFGGTFNVSNVFEWNQAVNSIRNGGNNRIYTIIVTGEISLPVSTGNSFGSVIGLQVTLEGGGSLTMSANGRVIEIGAGQTIITKNIILQGSSSNTAGPVVHVNGGIFRMEDGAVVRDNMNRGILVSGGTLIMHGGIVTDNSSSQRGGGVSLENASTLIMYQNAVISNNSSNMSGGGVFVGRGSNFIMEAGTVSANTSLTSGGGIFVDINASFIMNNGEITANRTTGSNQDGGGVVLASSWELLGERGGIFTMNGGSISTNTATRDGGGVCIWGSRWSSVLGGTFTLNGGLIFNNQAGRHGGGISSNSVGNFANGVFNKMGGTISGNTAAVEGNTAFRVASPNQWRNANAGPTINTADYGFWLND